MGVWGLFFLALFASLTSVSVAEQRAGGSNYVTLDFGAYGTNLKERVTVTKEMQRHVSSIHGFLRLRRGFHLGKHFFLEPGFGLVLPWRAGADGTTKTITTHIDLAFRIPVFSFLSFRAGPGVQWLAILSKQEAITLNNGTSTSVFYTPGGTANVWLFSVQTALEVHFSRVVSLNLGAYVSDIGSPLRRRYNGVVSLGISL